MFKQTTISKKIAAVIVAGLVLGSFSPVQAYSKEDAKRHAKIVPAVCLYGAMVAGGPVISWMSFKILLFYTININVLIKLILCCPAVKLYL
ncbi:MAG TPA: hypothetical protein ENI08_01575 [Candidatus Dependentiae bacterium]|nr:hypothetical protein [Candidatus Dependentiae bacterium]